MIRHNARFTAAIAAAAASLACAGAHAQEANAWEIVRVMGPMAPPSWTMSIERQDAATARTAATRDQVVAELQRSFAEGTYFAGNEGPTPQPVLERRAAAGQREAERIARAYQDEADRIARINAQRDAVAAQQAQQQQPAQPSTGADASVTTAPVEPSAAAPIETATPTPVPSDAATSQPVPSNDDGQQRQPDVRPNSELATGRGNTEGLTSTVPPQGDQPRTDASDSAGEAVATELQSDVPPRSDNAPAVRSAPRSAPQQPSAPTR